MQLVDILKIIKIKIRFEHAFVSYIFFNFTLNYVHFSLLGPFKWSPQNHKTVMDALYPV